MAPVYHSATLAGTASSSECSLYLCEGKSSINFILHGINVLGKTTTGALTMGGTIENIRGGLSGKKKRELKVESKSMKLLIDKIIIKSTNEPAYGTIVAAFDSDGFGLRALCTLISNVVLLWPALIQSQKLKLKVLLAPKSDHGHKTTSLGSISDTTAVAFFGEVSRGQHLVDVHYNPKRDDFYINIGFDGSSEWCALRKDWIMKEEKGKANEQAGEQAEQQSQVTVRQLIEKNLLKFYLNDVQRALPSALDGLSHRRRAVLLTFLQWNNTFVDKKVEQWAGLVEMVYNVPSAGLDKCITNMAASGVLQVEGSHGENNTDARYLYASLSTTGRLLFPSDRQLTIEHSRTEHQFFLPIIPSLLLFGGRVICAGVNVTLPRCSLFTLAENCRLKLNQQELLPFRCPKESSSGEKIIALDSSGKVITFHSIISYFEYWFAQSLLLLCTSGTSKNEVVKKWKQQLGVLLSDILKRPAHLTTTIVLAEEDEELESDDGGSSNLISGQSTYDQSTYDQSTYDQSTYGDTASESRDNEKSGGESGEQWANDDDQVGANEWQDNWQNDNFEEDFDKSDKEEEEEIITTKNHAPKKSDKKGKRSASAAFSPQSNRRSKRQAASPSTEETESTPPTPLPSRQRGQKFQCTDCDRSFRDFEKQQEHHLRDHLFLAPFKCIYLDCGATFYTKGAAGAHVQRCHKQSDKKKYSFVVDLRTV